MASFNDFIQKAKKFTSPQQAQKEMFNFLSNKNPELGNIIKVGMQEGKSPKEVLSKAIQMGKLTPQNFYDAKNVFTKFKRFIPPQLRISLADWNELESIFNNSNNNSFRF